MRYLQIVIVATLLLTCGGEALAFLDFGQDILEIPDTHEGKKYTWLVRDNPSDGKTILTQQPGVENNWLLTLQIPAGEKTEEVHLFVVDPKFKNFHHIIPHQKNDLQFEFSFSPNNGGKFRIETIVKTGHDWLRLSRDLVIPSSRIRELSSQEKGLSVLIKTIPAKVYADHVVTFVFEIKKDGRPVTNLERTGGFDMHLAAWRTSWFTRFGEFVYGRPIQNLGGPEVAVSMVFKKTGHYKVSGQYKLAGEVYNVATDLEVYYEPRPYSGGIQNLSPVED